MKMGGGNLTWLNHFEKCLVLHKQQNNLFLVLWRRWTFSAPAAPSSCRVEGKKCRYALAMTERHQTIYSLKCLCKRTETTALLSDSVERTRSRWVFCFLLVHHWAILPALQACWKRSHHSLSLPAKKLVLLLCTLRCSRPSWLLFHLECFECAGSSSITTTFPARTTFCNEMKGLTMFALNKVMHLYIPSCVLTKLFFCPNRWFVRHLLPQTSQATFFDGVWHGETQIQEWRARRPRLHRYSDLHPSILRFGDLLWFWILVTLHTQQRCLIRPFLRLLRLLITSCHC